MPTLSTLRSPFRWACIAATRRKLLAAEHLSPKQLLHKQDVGQSIVKCSIAALVEHVHREAIHRVSTQGTNKRGPCYSGILDMLTGTISYGANFEVRRGLEAHRNFCKNVHPLLKSRIDNHNQNLENDTVVVSLTAGPPASHAEIVALDEALKKRERDTGIKLIEADIETFYLHNRCTMNGRAGQPMPRCDNCCILTIGIKTILHL